MPSAEVCALTIVLLVFFAIWSSVRVEGCVIFCQPFIKTKMTDWMTIKWEVRTVLLSARSTAPTTAVSVPLQFPYRLYSGNVTQRGSVAAADWLKCIHYLLVRRWIMTLVIGARWQSVGSCCMHSCILTDKCSEWKFEICYFVTLNFLFYIFVLVDHNFFFTIFM